jgi:3-oxoacyl-[acyl-carrier-protein] synthase-1
MSVGQINIIGLGASTPIGRDIWSSAAAARAGLCGFSAHPYAIDKVGEPVRIARAPWIDASVEGVKRYLELLLPAVEQALLPLEQLRQREAAPIRVLLALALPAPRPGRPQDLARLILEAVRDQHAKLFTAVSVFECGHAAGLVACETAMNSLTSGTADACVVACVDSYLSEQTLEWIEECDQLHGGGPLNNAWGFIPGEGAAAILLAGERVAVATGLDAYGSILSVGIGQESNLIKSDAVCIGEGLTQAFRSALEGLDPMERIQNVFCDLNGEPYRADEYGFTALRTKERFRAAGDFIAPADCWGDVGAAGAALHVALAVIAHRKKYGSGALSLVWASSESGERGAAVIRAAGR